MRSIYRPAQPVSQDGGIRSALGYTTPELKEENEMLKIKYHLYYLYKETIYFSHHEYLSFDVMFSQERIPT